MMSDVLHYTHLISKSHANRKKTSVLRIFLEKPPNQGSFEHCSLKKSPMLA